MTDIISVKVAPRVIRAKYRTGSNDMSVFPFERVYLVKNLALAKKMFQYFLELELDEVLLEGLNLVCINRTISKGLDRQKDITDGGTKSFLDINLAEGWIMIVPTKIHKEMSGKKIITFLDYVSTNLSRMGKFHNTNITIPEVYVHTPDKRKTLLCAKCVHVTKMYHGDCSPANASCKPQIVIKAEEITETAYKPKEK